MIIVGNTPCGIGSGWLSKVLDWEAHGETRLVDLSKLSRLREPTSRALSTTPLRSATTRTAGRRRRGQVGVTASGPPA